MGGIGVFTSGSTAGGLLKVTSALLSEVVVVARLAVAHAPDRSYMLSLSRTLTQLPGLQKLWRLA